MSRTDAKELTKLVSFLVMGDGGVYMAGKNAYFVMTQREEHLDFVEYAADILQNVTGTRITAWRRDRWRLETRAHPLFTRLRERVYTGGYRGLDPHALKLLDWEAAAILYMSDGSCSPVRGGQANPGWRVALNLKRLSYGDQLLLKRALEEKRMGAWNIRRHNQYTYLSLATRHHALFLEGVAPFIVPSYRYKLARLAPARAG